LPTRRATIHLARALAPLLEPGDLVVLGGGLGAGKTFFTRALARALGVPRGVSVASPTFALVHEIDARLALVHVDAYRLGGAPELHDLGLGERRSQGAVLVVEWGLPYVGALGGDALCLSISTDPERVADVEATGPRSLALLQALGVG
jgi:tRNA threonylcarbamoyladenosine biosynthesis protein TsaE